MISRRRSRDYHDHYDRTINTITSITRSILFFMLLAFAACATPGETTREPTREPPDPPRTPVTRTVEGYRIQLMSTNNRAEADAAVEAAIDWYEGLAPSSRPTYVGNGDLDVHVAWRAPYYRVQIGSFANRAEADQAMRTVRQRFPDAFPVPATVTVTR